jgi:hypothetical protein
MAFRINTAFSEGICGRGHLCRCEQAQKEFDVLARGSLDATRKCSAHEDKKRQPKQCLHFWNTRKAIAP